MDRPPISMEDVHVASGARVDDGNADPWQQHQDAHYWNLQMYRLRQALETGNLGQAQQAFAALIDGVLERGLPAPVAHPQFANLGKALQLGDIEAAREAFSHIWHWPQGHKGQDHQAEVIEDSQEAGAARSKESTKALDVTA